MRLAYLAYLVAQVAADPHACDLLIVGEDPFRVRAVRSATNEWTGDAFLATWSPGAVLTFTWPQKTHLLSANHADVRETGEKSAVVALQETGPDDGSNRLMLHVEGTTPLTPQITCPGNGATSGMAGNGDASTPYTPVLSTVTVATHAPPPQLISSSHGLTVQTSIAREGGAAASMAGGLVAAADADPSSLPCARAATDLRLFQLAGVAALAATGGLPLQCDQLALRLPAIRLCDGSDKLTLQWLRPSATAWAPLQTLPSGQRFALLDGLNPYGAVQLRLALSLGGGSGGGSLADGAGRVQPVLGPSTGPLLTDGGALTELLSPRAAAPVPVAMSSSAASVPWAEGSTCRPGMHFAVRVLPAHLPEARERAGSAAADSAAAALAAALRTAPQLAPADITIANGALLLKRLRCPGGGCRLAISPVGTTGLWSAPVVSEVLTTSALPPVPENGGRMHPGLPSTRPPASPHLPRPKSGLSGKSRIPDVPHCSLMLYAATCCSLLLPAAPCCDLPQRRCCCAPSSAQHCCCPAGCSFTDARTHPSSKVVESSCASIGPLSP